MQRLLFFIIILISFQAVAQNTPSRNRWYKGNTHTHSYWSDGDDFPEMIMEWYKSHGYDFVCLSDHNVLAQGEKWKLVPDFDSHKTRFEEYLQKFGRDWVVYKTDTAGRVSVKLKTLDEYQPKFEVPGKFLIIQAEEITDSYGRKPVHINALNVKELIPPQGGNSVSEVMQNNINKVYEQRKATGQAMFPHINHPNFGWAITVDDMLKLRGERFFEVYNGHPLVNNYGDSLRPGTEQMWDRLLVNCIQTGQPLIYGLATDDAHNYLSYGRTQSNPGRGHVMVRAKELTATAIIEGMESGDFYSSTGVIVENLQFKKNTLSIKVKPEKNVEYTIQFFGARKDSPEGDARMTLLYHTKGTEAAYRMSKNDLYVRAKVISSKLKDNPYRDGDFETAWIQPYRFITRNKRNQ